jgi:hypothetical protein
LGRKATAHFGQFFGAKKEEGWGGDFFAPLGVKKRGVGKKEKRLPHLYNCIL